MARRLELWLAGTSLGVLLLYWLLWSIFGPVTNPDSEVYHLARLWVIEENGLFSNRAYTSKAQLIMPWSFDAVHYPLLRLRYGYALPSFLCLLGMMSIVFTWARERGDAVDGVRACLGLLAMPAVVMLASTTKNDLVLGFCLLCWIEALRRYSAQPSRAHLTLSALALGFLAGSKVTGLLYATVAIVVSLWVISPRRRDLVWFGATLALALVLVGSWEIYLNSYLEFGHWNGDPQWYRNALNRDGWRGFIANEVRYVASVLDVQLLPADALARIAAVKFDACQYILETLHLRGLGVMAPGGRPVGEETLSSLMTTPLYSENRATYGLIGMLLLTVGPVVFLVRWRLDFAAWLFLGGMVAQLLLPAAGGWHSANLRYFAAAACLAWAGMSLVLAARRHRWVSLCITIVAIAGAVLVPFRAALRNPANLAIAFHDRDSLHRDRIRQLIKRAESWRERGEVPVVLTGKGGPVFHLYDQLESNVITLGHVTEADLIELDEVYHRGQYRIVAFYAEELTLPNVREEESLPAYGVRVYVWRR